MCRAFPALSDAVPFVRGLGLHKSTQLDQGRGLMSLICAKPACNRLPRQAEVRRTQDDAHCLRSIRILDEQALRKLVPVVQH